jgi:DNA adenine methylase
MIFRYPGGKNKLLPVIMHYLVPVLDRTDVYYEPFIGGGSVVIEVAKRYPDKQLIVNDFDYNMSSFWGMIACGSDSQWATLEEKIKQQPTVDMFNQLRSETPTCNLEGAYHAIFFNRCTFSGIATSGPIGGQGQKSRYTVDCRYNADRLIKECRELRKLMSGRLSSCYLQFQAFLEFVTKQYGNGAIYLDPPYYVKGPELYPCSMGHEDHVELARQLRERKNWVLSYDVCDEIADLYSFANCIMIDAKYSISGVKTTWAKKQEYIIVPSDEGKYAETQGQ